MAVANLFLKKTLVKDTSAKGLQVKDTFTKMVTKNNFAKEIEEKVKEKTQLYNYIGIEVYELYEAGKINIPELDVYFEKMNILKEEITALENEKQKVELQRKGVRQCSCGNMLTMKERFCSSCGKPVDNGFIVCTCGTELKSDIQFCPNCGNNIQNMKMAQQTNINTIGTSQVMSGITQTAIKECICGAKIQEGQFICMECGRKV